MKLIYAAAYNLNIEKKKLNFKSTQKKNPKMEDLNDDIDMLNDLNAPSNTMNHKSNLNDSLNNSPDVNHMNQDPNTNEDEEDDLDDSFILDSDTKTPGEILDEFCDKLQDINTTIPDTVINYYMRKSGFIVNDPKLVKIISIASQKFVSEIVNDVWQRQKLKTKATAQGGAQASSSGTNQAQSSSAAASTSAAAGAQGKQKAGAPNAANAQMAQLTLEDLTQVLADYGVNVKKPYYFI